MQMTAVRDHGGPAVPITTPVQVRWMIRRDFTQVIDVEVDCFGNDGFTEQDISKMMLQKNTIGLVACISDDVVGYSIYQTVGSDLEIVSIAVHPDYQRQGVGTQLIAKIYEKLWKKHNRLVVVVNEHFVGAQIFFSSLEFIAGKILKGYFAMKGEDGYEFVLLPGWNEDLKQINLWSASEVIKRRSGK